MTVEERIKNRKIGIIGMARSGLAAALLAQEMGGQPFVTDSGRPELLVAPCEKLAAADIPYETGGHTDRILECDYVIISPGVPLTVDIVTRLQDRAIPIFSEIEFASWVCRGTIVAVTGSNGKTTTTTLIGEMLKAAGLETFVCGNIGRPFAEVAADVPRDGVAVVEVSNFQLETIADFRPHLAMILNISADHLDRHGTMAAYKQAKYRITENQSRSDYLVLNRDDSETDRDAITTNARRLLFTTADDNTTAAFVRDSALWSRLGDDEQQIIPVDDIMIPGPHNLQNAAAAVVAATIMGASPDVLQKTLSTFPGVEHRLERVGSVAGISFINDSKATNVDAVCFALQSVKPPVYLIAGGRDKGASYAPLLPHAAGKVKGIVAIGEAREKILNELGRDLNVQFADSLEEAVRKCFDLAFPGETVLLSPACASFDMFENFEHRGRAFKTAVAELKNGKKNQNAISH